MAPRARPAVPGADAVARAAAGRITVEVADVRRGPRVSSRALARVVRRALAVEGVTAAEIGVTIVGDRRMARMHEEWLGIAGPTDVITFDLSAGDPAAGPGIRGDIVASADTARRRAREFGWPARCELAYYVVHGLLHLAGYDDTTPAERRAMRARERRVMKACGLPLPPPRRPTSASGRPGLTGSTGRRRGPPGRTR